LEEGKRRGEGDFGAKGRRRRRRRRRRGRRRRRREGGEEQTMEEKNGKGPWPTVCACEEATTRRRSRRGRWREVEPILNRFLSLVLKRVKERRRRRRRKRRRRVRWARMPRHVKLRTKQRVL